MALVRPLALVSATLVMAVTLVFAAFFISFNLSGDDVRTTGERQLQIVALDLEAVLERYDSLPYAITRLPLAAQVLQSPNNSVLVRQLNAELQDMQQQARIVAIFMMDLQGNTIASSNWDSAQTYVGQNFSFRPYFMDAMRGKTGYFYAVGNTTGIPGYFISQPVYPVGSRQGSAPPMGVIAVKITLEALEQAWRSNLEPIVLADHQGVVFLSNRADWRYRSLRALDTAQKHGIEQTLQYVGHDIQPVSGLPSALRADFGEYVARPVGRLGWQLMLFPSQAKVLRTSFLVAAAMLLLLMVAAAMGGVVYQRARRRQERHEAQLALKKAADELESKIGQRTQDLQAANEQLAGKYDALQQTETLLRTTQNELVQAGKLAMLGQMAAGITHELNQPLTAIRAFADNAATFLQRGNVEQTRENLQHISAASARMGSMLGQLKVFARKSPQAVAVVGVNQAARDAALLLQSELTRNEVQLELDLPEDILVLGDSVRVEQVLINLLRNAMDAVERSPVKCVQVRLLAQGTQAVIRIIDSGSGLPDSVMEHLFEPFFTTKASGRGLGLGLAISSSIVQAMNGRLEATNNGQGGATFTVTLPRFDETTI